jgi:mono/diheme cytochrome c family protein
MVWRNFFWMLAVTMLMLALMLVVASIARAESKKVAQGKAFAIEACSACHQVRPGQTPPAPVHDANFDQDVAAPSFMEIARNHGTNIDFLRKHITQPEWPMREQEFDEYYLQDIIAYIQSLQPKSNRKPQK